MKEITPATKSRSTKLSKKTKEELIEVILRKDSVERKLNEKVENYKTTIEEKIAKIITLKQTIGGLENACGKYKLEIDNLNKNIDALEISIEERDNHIAKCKTDIKSAIAQRNANEEWAIKAQKTANLWSAISIISILVISVYLILTFFTWLLK